MKNKSLEKLLGKAFVKLPFFLQLTSEFLPNENTVKKKMRAQKIGPSEDLQNENCFLQSIQKPISKLYNSNLWTSDLRDE